MLEFNPMSMGKRNINLAPIKGPQPFEKVSIWLEGVPLTKQAFSWSFLPGPSPYVCFLTFPNELHRAVSQLSNPVTVTIVADGEIAGKKEKDTIKIENLYLIEGRQEDKYHWSWELRDSRFLWRGEKITLKANRTWKTNLFAEGETVTGKDPGALRLQFVRYAKYRYIPWSLKNEAKPWTALELLEEAFNQLPGPKPGQWPPDNGFIQENIAFEEEDSVSVLSTLCNMARVNIGIDLAGNPYIYSIDELDKKNINNFIPLDRMIVEGGVVYRENRHRIRPPRCQVKFRKKQEVIVRFQPQDYRYQAKDNKRWALTSTSNITQKLIDEGRAVCCQNVVRLPNDIQYGGKWYQRNTYMLLNDYLSAIKLTEKQIREAWFKDLLLIYHAGLGNSSVTVGAQGELDLQAAMQVRALQRAYRRIWQIDPYFVQRWESWEAIRCAVVDAVTGFSSPSPVWQDICILPQLRPPTIKRVQAKLFNVHGGYNWIIFEKDPKRIAPLTVASISILDAELGIFEVTFPDYINSVIHDIIPSAVTIPPSVAPTAPLHTWEGCHLREQFEFETIISVVPALDKKGKMTEDQFQSVKVSNRTRPAKGPEIEYLSTLEVARFPVLMGLSEQNLGLGKTKLSEAKAAIARDLPINLGYIVPLAQAEASRIFLGYIDRWAGYASCAGVDMKKLKLFGQCQRITITWNENDGGLKSFYDLTQRPGPPELQNFLPTYAKKYLYKQLPKVQ